jgi:hypothetical protein
MGSANVEEFVAYCKKCKRRRRFMSVKVRASGGFGFSLGVPTRYICSKNHTYTQRPPKYPPKKRS